MTDETLLLKKLEREKAARIEAEVLLERKGVELHNCRNLLKEKQSSSELSLFETLFQQSSDGIILTDLKGHAFKVNKRFCNIFNILDIEIEDHFLVDVLMRFGISWVTSYRMYIGVKNNKTLQVKMNLPFSGGSKLLELSSKLIEMPNFSFIQTVVKDISAELSQDDQLRKLEEKAFLLQQTKTNALTVIGKGVQKKLNEIVELVENLPQDTLESQQKSLLQQVHEKSLLSRNVINKILYLTQLESHSITLQNSEFDLAKCLEKGLEKSFHDSPSIKANWIGFISPQVPERIFGDEEKLQHTLVNLIISLWSFSDEGPLCMEANISENQELILEISHLGLNNCSDNYKGFLSAFQQPHHSTIDTSEGTNLNLLLSKKLIALMDGEIFITPPKENPFILTITLPIQPVGTSTYGHLVPLSNPVHILAYLKDSNVTHFLRSYTEELELSLTTCDTLSTCESLLESTYDIFVSDQLLHKEFFDIHQPKKFRQSIFIAPHPSVATQQEGYDNVLHSPLFFHNLSQLIQTDITTHSKDNVSVETAPEKVKVLLVEDNLINAKLAVHLLDRLEFAVEIAENGQEALEMLSKTEASYPFICMDIRMPLMDGLEATRKIRAGEAGERWQTIPIIAMTANTSAQDRLNCFQAGMSYFLTKPLNADELAFVINELNSG